MACKKSRLKPPWLLVLGYAQARVHHEKPTSIAEVQEIVTKVARNCRKEIVERAAMNIAKRASKCFDKNGSHFESEMWNKVYVSKIICEFNNYFSS